MPVQSENDDKPYVEEKFEDKEADDDELDIPLNIPKRS